MTPTSNIVLQAEGLTKTFHEGTSQRVVAVRNVSLTAQRSEFIIIAGPSGSGKTTLLSLIGALAPASSGTVSICGTTLASLSATEMLRFRRTTIGFAFQGFRLLDCLSARENIELALQFNGAAPAARTKRSTELLEHVHLQHKADTRASELSGGEKQRVALARALANDATLILADEPTGNLDSKNGDAVVELLMQTVREHNKCVIAVSHDSRIFKYAHRVLTMEDGELKG